MAESGHHVIVVGAGPVGLTLAGRLAQRGVAVTVCEQAPRHEREGSKALCMQRETLEIWARLGIGERIAERGVQWRVGRTYFRGRELFSVTLPGGEDDHFPPFVNISQTEVEQLLLARLAELGVDVRWGHRVTELRQDADGVDVTCETPDGRQSLRAAWVVGADGAHSSVRHLLGVGFPGHSHADRFLICDVRARLSFPNERRFFFDPPWNPGRQVLVHPQPDGAWRIDWQLPPDADIDAERADGRLHERIREVVGDADYELLWMTVYHFHQRLTECWRVGRVFLAGDAAHLFAPFGARGLNSGACDAENLSWKLAAVLGGDAPERLLDTYEQERGAAARENLAVTDATMRFMAPQDPLRRAWRNLVLRASPRMGWFRRRVNSGRLAEPFSYLGSPIVAPGAGEPGLPRLGAVAPDAPCSATLDGRPIRRLRELLGDGFVLLLAGAGAARAVSGAPRGCRLLVVDGDALPGGIEVKDPDGALVRTYAPDGPRAWLIRPDAHLADSFAVKRGIDLEQRAAAAMAMALGRPGSAQ